MFRIGKIGDLYRPMDSMTFPKEFALVGFYDPAHVQAAIQLLRREGAIEGIPVSGEEAKQWLLDLYPRS
jgi:RNA recognition motif-containing protein